MEEREQWLQSIQRHIVGNPVSDLIAMKRERGIKKKSTIIEKEKEKGEREKVEKGGEKKDVNEGMEELPCYCRFEEEVDVLFFTKKERGESLLVGDIAEAEKGREEREREREEKEKEKEKEREREALVTAQFEMGGGEKEGEREEEKRKPDARVLFVTPETQTFCLIRGPKREKKEREGEEKGSEKEGEKERGEEREDVSHFASAPGAPVLCLVTEQELVVFGRFFHFLFYFILF